MPITFNTFNDPAALPGTTYAYGVNDTGQIVGWYYDGSGNGGNHGFLLSGGTYTSLLALEGNAPRLCIEFSLDERRAHVIEAGAQFGDEFVGV
jgi:probable HAF family extracellular repeat protein